MNSAHVSKKQTDAFGRFFTTLPHGKDLVLVIIKGHLLLEEQIRSIVDERLTKPSALADSRLDCHQSICLAEALCPKVVPQALWKAAKKLNKIRNEVAHNLNPQGIDDRILDFIKTFPSGFDSEEEAIQERFEKSLLSLFTMMASLT